MANSSDEEKGERTDEKSRDINQINDEIDPKSREKESREGGTIPPQENFEQKEDRGRSTTRKRKKKRYSSSSSSSSSSPSSSSSNSSSSSSSSEERRKRRKKRRRKKSKRRRKDSEEKESKLSMFSIDDKENSWELDNNLAKYIEDNILNYVQDKDIEKDILGKYPVPENITKIPKMDQTIDVFLRGKGTPGKVTLSKDKSLVRISNKIRDTLGPLTIIWQKVERARAQKNSDTVLNLEELALNFQHTMLLIGQAINAVNFYRRKSSLVTLGNKENDVNNMLRETYQEDLKKNKEQLFGETFFKSMNKHAKATNKTVKQILIPPQEFRPRKPFQVGSLSKRNRDEEQKKSGGFNQNSRPRGNNYHRGRGRGRGGNRT